MRLEAIQWESGQPLTDDYGSRFEKTGELYDYNPWEMESWRARASWLDHERVRGADRQRVADVLRRFNERAGNACEAMDAIERLRDPQTLCVVGGQQASLFTGPLLVIYKAITLIRTAREFSEKLNRPVVPVFWIAGEDHDFDEVNHVNYLTSNLQVDKIKVDHPTGLRTSVSQTKLNREQWEEALQQLEQSLMPTEFKDGLVQSLRAAAEESATLVDGFARLMAKLFGSYGLVLLDSDDPALRKLEGTMFRTMVERSSELSDAFLMGREQLLAAGYEPQAELHTKAANLFVYDEEGERTLLYADDNGGFTDRKGERRFSRERLLDWADTAPERLSNNVMTRPLMQEFILPVLAAVLGPAEIAYWGLTREAFHRLGMRMPLLVPRLGFTLVEGTVHKNMQKYGLTFEDVLQRLEDKQQEWLRAQDRLQLEARFSEVKEQFRIGYEPLIAAISEINPGLKKLGDTNLGKIIEQIEFLQHKAEDGLRSQNEAGLRQFQRIGLSIVPGGKAQERVYNISAYLNKYGEGWLKELLELPMNMDGKHYICYM
ncbi:MULTISPECIES: bacillithiol biosynthesis cysteine-adding enzyme BshC [unclassified Paenibacillus]|uniref:bacillithiol biosynthesis cysteine-adding enzyme BshC n=1 Tax=unclassified Paenibacillus TaxID=185978 RepID=UPI001AE355C0|nr:bacillithiol biosynthesis cysteine-adding enzyme BshC [Paenibacillus sp. PvP091]MBP1168325.1 bacillithiol biosynthesis cysteine-adding enzyme BshC [Paenibacillus sp. PvR098]MBP2439353.1 bacillithiol biosynthesis cysteine-adding enzyme BshC [Paenibacillus sp. PvP052]